MKSETMTMPAHSDLRGELFPNELLSAYTSWRVGGPARQLYRPADIDDLAYFLQQLEDEGPLVWLGLGSNVLIRDGGVPGTVINTLGRLNDLQILANNSVRVEAGVSCATMARFCARASLQGVEFLAGIPGTMGGALAMNAGCFGGETWEYISAVETLDRSGKRHLRTPKEYQISYRSVIGPATDEWFVAGHFVLPAGDRETSLQKIRTLLEHRAATQPTGEPNCGSVFRNPPQDFAGRLIETCGLKGFAVGGASVSEKHANFIVNNGAATAADIETLMSQVATRVEQDFGVRLIQEVHIIGLPS